MERKKKVGRSWRIKRYGKMNKIRENALSSTASQMISVARDETKMSIIFY